MPNDNTLTDTETATEAPTQKPAFDQPDAEGVFTTYETVNLSGMPVKTCGQFFLARHRPGPEAERIYVGYFLNTRQPANTAKQLPSLGMPHFPDRQAALAWLVDEVAAKFFSEHKAASQKLAAWWVGYADRAGWRTEERRGVPATEKLAVGTPRPTEDAAPAAEPALAASAAPAGELSARYDFIPLEAIEPNPKNPRKEIPEAELRELAESIRAPGFLLHAIVLRDLGNGRFRLIAGERRWRAHQLLGWARIEAKIFSGCSDELVAVAALIENLQREGLNPMEEAEGFADLKNAFGYSEEKIAERTGKAESTIKNAMRLIALAEPIRNLVRARKLSVRRAKVLAATRWVSRPEHCLALAQWITSPAAEGIAANEFEDGLVAVLSRGAARALAAAGLAVNVSSYKEHIDPASYTNAREEHQKSQHGRRGADIMPAVDGTLWHLAPAQWKAEKKAIDEAIDARRKREADRAARKVTAAKESGVNLRVADLAKSGTSYQQVAEADLRYLPHLPTNLVATGLDAEEREVVLCLQPEEFAAKIGALKAAEAALLAADRDAKLPKIHDQATAKLRALKRIGARELTWLIVNAGAWALFEAEAFRRQDVAQPEQPLIEPKQLEGLDAVVLARVALEGCLLHAREAFGAEAYGRALRWILGVDKLGLAEEYDESREQILAQAAAKAFPKVTTDAATLAQWVKARNGGMPIKEIARAFKTTEADVAGALGESVSE